MLTEPVSEPIFEASAPVPILEVSALIEEPELMDEEEVSVLTEVESEDELEPPLPHAAKAPNRNTNNNFFIVSLLIVVVDLKVNTCKKEK